MFHCQVLTLRSVKPFFIIVLSVYHNRGQRLSNNILVIYALDDNASPTLLLSSYCTVPAFSHDTVVTSSITGLILYFTLFITPHFRYSFYFILY